jgi:DNA-binding transcriptional ArsR family regulator
MPEIQINENLERKEIELFLSRNKRASINQIAEANKLSWATVKKHLDYLESIGRVHGERLGNSIIYFFNGDGEWQERVWLNPKHILFLDTFISQFGEPFIRIKEVKKKEKGWETFGEVMITKDRIKDVIEFLDKVQKKIESYRR